MFRTSHHSMKRRMTRFNIIKSTSIFSTLLTATLLVMASISLPFLNAQAFVKYTKEPIKDEYNTYVPSYIPDGSDAGISDPQCSAYQLKKIMQGHNGFVPTEGDLQNKLKYFFQVCTKNNVPAKMKSSFGPLIRFVRINYPFQEDSRFKYITAKLKDGRKVKGILGLKDSQKPLPLVIFKCGVFCDTNPNASINSMIYQLFDESPFHILAVGNLTGEEFVLENMSPGLGGFDEGRQLFEIADWIQAKDSPLQSKVSSVHVVGASLGGHAALYSSLYASSNLGTESYKPVISSVIGICPVVNLEKAMSRFFKNDLLSRGAAIMASHQLQTQIMMLPILRNYYKLTGNYSDEEALAAMSNGSFEFYKQWTEKKPWDLQPFQGTKFTNKQQFWDVNNFPLYSQKIKIPTMVVHSTNDMIVESEDNALELENRLQTPEGANPLMFTLDFKYGNHCAFSVAQGWNRIGTMYREWILRNSPEMQQRRHIQTIQLPKKVGLNAFGRWAKYKWVVTANNPTALLTLISFNPIGEACYQLDPFEFDESSFDNSTKGACAVTNFAQIPLSVFNQLGIKGTPRTNFEAESMARILNTHAVVTDAKGVEIYSSQNAASAISYEYYQ